jgi:hypothetical protein
MTQDPTFVFNADAPPVVRVHEATLAARCNEPSYQALLRAGLVLPNGRHVAIASTAPAALRIEQYTTSGPPATIQDNQAAIDTMSPSPAPTTPGHSATPVPAAVGSASPVPSVGFACQGCAPTNAPPSGQGSGEGLAYALVGGGWWGFRLWVGRRRRR